MARSGRIVDVKEGETVFEPESANDVFFPIDSVISLLREFPDGGTLELSMVGAEGMAGLNVFLGVPEAPYRGLIQGRGLLFRQSHAAFRETTADPQFHALLMRYAHVMLMHTSQLAVCNRLHVVTERLAHWLLLLHDRVAADEMSLTQDFLARMLATRRAGINVAIRELTEAGAITHRRNRVVIADRARLEEQSCECYEAMVGDYQTALGFRPHAVTRETRAV